MRVLIAEDEWLVAAALRRQVESHGYEVVGTVGTGTDALKACCAQVPDVVLMDVQMPGLDGLTATRALMAQCPTCVIIVTGKGRSEQAAAEAGAMSYVVKPLLSSQIPTVVDTARRRYERFVEVMNEAASFEEGMEAWLTVQNAVRAICEGEGLSEEEAFETLRQRAGEKGVTLGEAAGQTQMNAEGRG